MTLQVMLYVRIMKTIIPMSAETCWHLKLRNYKTKPGTPDAMFPSNGCGFGPKCSTRLDQTRYVFKALPDRSSDEFTDS